MKRSIAHKLLARTDFDNATECWNWTGAKADTGYGTIWDGQRVRLAHILSFIIHKGASPDGNFVLHTCDNRSCVNPDHLVLGSHDDNMRDMVTKGRSAKGERHSQAKLTEKEVREIRVLAEGPTRAARLYGVTAATICDIRKRRSWTHV